MIALSSLIVLYYNVMNCWALYFLSTSFSEAGIVQNASDNKTFLFESFVYLKEMSGLDPEVHSWTNFGELQWPLVLCMMATWIIIALALYSGIQYSTYLIYFASLYPFFFLIILWIISFTLQGAMDGVNYFLSWNGTELADIKVLLIFEQRKKGYLAKREREI